jgi:hypothetical protein
MVADAGHGHDDYIGIDDGFASFTKGFFAHVLLLLLLPFMMSNKHTLTTHTCMHFVPLHESYNINSYP